MEGERRLLKRLLRSGKFSLAHFLAILRHGVRDRVPQIGVRLNETGHEAGGQPQHVVRDQHLAVASRAGADADGGDVDARGESFGQRSGDALDNDAEGAGLLGGDGVGQHLIFRPLDLVAAEDMHALRLQADVGHHGDTGRDEGGDGGGLIGAAFELDGLALGFLEDAAGESHGFARSEVGGGEGHVDDDERTLDGAADEFGVIDDFVEGDGEGVFATLHDHGEAIADEDGVDTGVVQEPCEREVVGGEHADLPPRALERHELGDGQLGGGGWGFGHGGLRRRKQAMGGGASRIHPNWGPDVRKGEAGSGECAGQDPTAVRIVTAPASG